MLWWGTSSLRECGGAKEAAMRAKNPKRSVAVKTTVLLSAVLSSVPLSAQQVPSVELGRNQNGAFEAILTDLSLQVHGATPGGEVAYLGANLVEHRESWGSLDTYSGILTDSEASGQVEFAPKGGEVDPILWTGQRPS
jgi:hypothetical protein